MGIIGGTDNQGFTAFAAFVSPDGTVTPFPAVAANTNIVGVSINASGTGLIGGFQTPGGIPYAAFVAPDGTLTDLSSLLPLTGSIGRAAINASGIGLLGGQSPTDAIAARVGTDGSYMNLSPIPVLGYIFGVAINDSAEGIIGGGYNGGAAYAALVDPNNGSLNILTPLPANGQIYGVAINASGEALIGGRDNLIPYAANVDPDGTVHSLTFPAFNGLIVSVDLNSSRKGILGGYNNVASTPYAARVVDGVVIPLSSLPAGNGSIETVAMNDAGTALIGGLIGGNAYAALVDPDGNVIALPSLPVIPGGSIASVAINNVGIGLIGGGYNFPPNAPPFFNPSFAALVAPDGTVTPLSALSIPTMGEINSVAINDEEILSMLVPESFGPFSSLANVMFDLTKVLETFYIAHHKKKSFKALESQKARPELSNTDEVGLLADAGSELAWEHGSYLNFSAASMRSRANSAAESEAEEAPIQPETKKGVVSFWISPFGDMTYQKAEQKIPAYTNKIAGILTAAEYEFENDAAIGGGLGYAFNYVHYGQGLGHASIHQEFAVVYGSYNRPHFFLNAAVWGGLYQMSNTRRTPMPLTATPITSKSHPSGWLLSPHLELAFPCCFTHNDWFLLEPFFMADWANNWQGSLKEHGASGFNISLKSHYASLLRSEAGVRFYEIFRYGWGHFILEEKGSYVNKAPFHSGASSAVFIGAISSFAIETFSAKIQNLGVVQMSCNFLPADQKYPYGALSFQGEFGSSFQSYLLVFNIGRDF